jgi:DNA uptake protein ComE-like DNA-binding protein
MKISISRHDRAFAVIIALVAVVVLTMLAGMFAYAMKVETRLAANTNDDEDFYWIGRGGVDRACWWLALEGNQPFSSLHQYWNHGEGDGPETNGPLAGESLDNFQIGEGTVSLTMVEEESKININTAPAPLLQQVLTAQGADADAISVVSDSVLDWINPGDAPRPAGAKSDYYLGLTPPYYCKDALIDNLDELQLVKGVTRDMYNGGNSSGAAPPIPEHQLGFGHAPGQEPVYLFGLKDVFTPYSSGKINILTASDTVLQLIPGVDTSAAQAIESARESDPPIRNVQGLMAAAGLDPQVVGPIMSYVDIRGNTYEVHATVTIGQLTHEYTAVVFRNGPNVTVFNFYRSK